MRNADRWQALEVRHLRAFATAVEQPGSPTPSGGRRRLELTETERVVLAHAHPMLARVKAAQTDVASLARRDAGQLTTGTFQSFGARMPAASWKRPRRRAANPSRAAALKGVEMGMGHGLQVNEIAAGAGTVRVRRR